MSTDTDVVDAFFLEAFAPENRADPYALYARMRDAGQLLSANGEMHLAFGHAACWSILRNPAASSDERHSTVLRRQAKDDPRAAAMLEARPLLVFMDPPDHTRLRGLVANGFTPRRVEALRSRIREITDDLIARMAEVGDADVDVVEHLASPLPIAVICELLGVAGTDRSLFRDWSLALPKSVDPSVLRTDADNAAIDNATDELRVYTTALLDDRRSRPSDDLLSALARRHGDDDHLGDDELADLVTLLLVAGHETTANLITNGLHALLANRDQLDDWARHPEIGDQAIDELLRFDAPLQLVQRTATQDLTLHGLHIRPGEQIIVMLGAANRDPAEFQEPDRLDIRRPNASRHLAFGGGIHHCLGAALARAEGAIALTALLRAFPEIEAAGPAPIRDTFNLRGRARLPVRLGTHTRST